MKMEDVECEFCRELRGEPNLYSEVAVRSGLPAQRLIYEGRHWVIWPTIGALVPGYVLIVPKKHRFSVMSCSGEEIDELEHLLARTRKRLQDIYHYPCIAFEHGSKCGSEMKTACIEHCHVHVLPLKEDIYHRIDFAKTRLHVTPIDSLHDLCKNGNSQEAYLLYQNHEGQFFKMCADMYLSQYFRQLIALSEGIPEKWNWRQYYFAENIFMTINDFRPGADKKEVL